jgi:hypothetical protein
LPKGFEGIQASIRRVLARRAQACLDLAKSALELGVRMAERRFGIDIEMSRQVDDGEQQVADFILKSFH